MSDQSENLNGQKRSKIAYIAIIAIAIVVIVSIIIMIGNNRNRKTNAVSSSADGLVTVIDPKTINYTTANETLEGAVFQSDADPEVADVINKYFVAKSECDVNTLNSIVESKKEFSEDTLKQEGEFIEDYKNIKCYTVNGLVENTYLVYVYYETKFLNVDTPAPSLIHMYVYKDKDGSVYINQGEIDGALSTFIQETNNSPEVRKLITSVNTQLTEALKSDPDLNSLYEMLSKSQLPESSVDATEKTSMNETKTTNSSTKTDSTVSTTTDTIE